MSWGKGFGIWDLGFGGREKKGAVNWTVGKLLRIILLVVVLALLAYGYSVNGLNPLLEKVEGKYDEVLIMLKIREGVSFDECYSEKVVNLGGGKELLKEVNLEGKDVVLNVCRNRICNFSGGLDYYRISEGVFERWDRDEWVKDNSVFKGEPKNEKFNWELWNGGVDILEKANVRDIYDAALVNRFVLYGDETTATWFKGEWIVNVEGSFVSYDNDDEAIDAFYKEVSGWVDDAVSYKVDRQRDVDAYVDYEDVEYGESIGNLVGDLGWLGSFHELDSDEEVEVLKEKFKAMKKVFLEEAKLSKEQADRLKAIEGQSFVVMDKNFVVSIKDEGKFPVIGFSSGGDKFGLKYNPGMNSGFFVEDVAKGFLLSSYPFSLVKWEDGWKEIGNENSYRLFREDFKEVYRTSLVGQFLSIKCR